MVALHHRIQIYLTKQGFATFRRREKENGDIFEATYDLTLKSLIPHIKKSLWFWMRKR